MARERPERAVRPDVAVDRILGAQLRVRGVRVAEVEVGIVERDAHHGEPYRSRWVFDATASRRGGPSVRAGRPIGITAIGVTSSGRSLKARSWSATSVVSVVSAEP